MPYLSQDADAVEPEDRPASAAAADGPRHDHEAHEARRHAARYEGGQHPLWCGGARIILHHIMLQFVFVFCERYFPQNVSAV